MPENDLPPSSDHHLREAVLQAFSTDESIAVLNLRVGVLNGIAHLAGSAPSLAARGLAEQIAASVPGVRGVVNRIEAPGAPDPSRTIHLDIGKQEEPR